MPGTELYLVEIRTDDRAALASWYVETLGLVVTLDDPEGNYTLLAAGPARLAIQGGRTALASGSVGLVFLVDDVAAEHRRLSALEIAVSPIQESPEGYRAIRLIDPAGHPIQLFQWLGPPP